jgi:hypothetical protein
MQMAQIVYTITVSESYIDATNCRGGEEQVLLDFDDLQQGWNIHECGALMFHNRETREVYAAYAPGTWVNFSSYVDKE